MKAYVGQIVRFNEVRAKDPWCAIVIALPKDEEKIKNNQVDLQVFSPVSGGVHIARGVPYAEKQKESEGSWCFIPEAIKDVSDSRPLPWELEEEKRNEQTL